MIASFVFSSSSLAARSEFEFSPPPEFKEERSLFGDDRSFVLPGLNGEALARITISRIEEQGPILSVQAPPTVDQLNQVFLAGRSSGLEILGFSHWTISQSSLERVGSTGIFLYKVQGQYLNPNRISMSYLEWHYIRGNVSFQLGWTQRSVGNSDPSFQYARQVLARFKFLSDQGR